MERCQNLVNPHWNATWGSYHSSFFRWHCDIIIALWMLRNWGNGELRRNLSENVLHVLQDKVESSWEIFCQKDLIHLNKTHREKFCCNSVIFTDWLATYESRSRWNFTTAPSRCGRMKCISFLFRNCRLVAGSMAHK